MPDEETLDAIREVINIGVGEAASALSKLVNSRVVITVPEIKIVEVAEVPEVLKEELHSLGVYIAQPFHGAVTGKALLFYTRDCSLELLQCLSGAQGSASTLTSTEMATLQEIGNILMVSCLVAIGNVIDDRVAFAVPEVTMEVSSTYFRNLVMEFEESDKAVVVRNEITVKGRNISGYLILLLNFSEFRAVVDKLRRGRTGHA